MFGTSWTARTQSGGTWTRGGETRRETGGAAGSAAQAQGLGTPSLRAPRLHFAMVSPPPPILPPPRLAEERELGDGLGVQRRARAADEHVGRDAERAQLLDGVLRRLRLLLADAPEHWHERDVDEEDVVGADAARELPQRLEEDEGLDVADRPADLRGAGMRGGCVVECV